MQVAQTRSIQRRSIHSFVRVILVVLGAICVSAMMILSMSDAILRYFGYPIMGASEISESLLLLLVASALPLSVLAGKAISVDLFVDRLPSTPRKFVITLTAIISAVLVGYLSFRLFGGARDAADYGEASLLLQIPAQPLYLALATGCAAAGLSFVYNAVVGETSSTLAATPEEKG